MLKKVADVSGANFEMIFLWTMVFTFEYTLKILKNKIIRGLVEAQRTVCMLVPRQWKVQIYTPAYFFWFLQNSTETIALLVTRSTEMYTSTMRKSYDTPWAKPPVGPN